MNKMQHNDSFIVKVDAFIAAHHLLEPGERVIAAVSGGPDSVAMLAALVTLGYDCVVAHVNFHLRGDESNRDEQMVRDLCAQHSLMLEVMQADVPAQCRATGESVEMACRTLRYDWFERLRQQYGARYVAVAHHRDDQLETVILNALRGTGLTGLTGMRPLNNRHIVRPLLGVSHDEIMNFISQNGLPFVIDSTNAQVDYRRNRIRNIVMPALDEAVPDARDRLLDTIARVTDAHELYTSLVAQARSTMVQEQPDGSHIDAPPVTQPPPRRDAPF